MSSEDCWETIWPPECIDDEALISRMIDYSKSQIRMQKAVWANFLASKFLTDLHAKSGKVSEPFIKVAIDTMSPLVGSEGFAIYIHHVLTQYIPDDTDDKEAVSMKLYQGCIWEIFATFVCMQSDSKNPPASCFEPFDRLVHIRSFI